MEYMLMPYRKLYRLIEGRSGRREFWMFVLLNVIVYIALFALIFGIVGGAGMSMADPTNLGAMMAGAGAVVMIVLIIPFYIWALLTTVASIAVTIRRLHDLNLTGWVYLIYPLLLVGAAAISPYLMVAVAIGWIVVMCLPGTKGPNKYGSDPTDPNAEAGPEVFA